MFGYVVVNKPEMKFKEFDLYHSYYCGLCKTLKDKFGLRAQVSLNFDMNFLALLLTGLYAVSYTHLMCIRDRANACHPVLGYNYGAGEYNRVLQGIKFVTLTSLSMMLILWLSITIFPELFIKIFSHNQEIINNSTSALRLYFFVFS